MKIFINPGHGAKVPDSAGNPPSPPPVDPGAVGLAKYEEATVNLAIANKLMTKLSGYAQLKLYQSGGHTRTGGYLTLADINNEANNWGADCIISIHANANNNREKRGISTYYQNNNAEGKTLAEKVHWQLIGEFYEYGRDNDDGVLSGNFQVLRDTNCIGILAEIGFISNPLDEEMMQKEWWWNAAATGLAMGIDQHFNLGIYSGPALAGMLRTGLGSDILCPFSEPAINMQMGSQGDNVRWVQWHLSLCGFFVAVDGVFGRLTDTAVRGFQSRIGLSVDGIVGPMTRSKLKNRVALYVNGSTREPTYSTTANAKAKVSSIGYLDPGETATCYGKVDGCYALVYNASATKKTGFVTYSGRVGSIITSGLSYHNGSTIEPVYVTTADASTKRNSIGSLDSWETCECFAKVDGYYLVVYNAAGTKKIGFVAYSGGL